MTSEVVTVGPDSSAEYAGELMAERGFAALAKGQLALIHLVLEPVNRP